MVYGGLLLGIQLVWMWYSFGMDLVYWYGFGMDLVWIWYGFGMDLYALLMPSANVTSVLKYSQGPIRAEARAPIRHQPSEQALTTGGILVAQQALGSTPIS